MKNTVLATTDRQERVRYSLQLARVKYEVQEIAERIGCTRQTLSPFMKGKELGEKLLAAAEQFAREEGLWLWDTPGDNRSGHEIWSEAAGDFEALAAVLRSNAFSHDAKAQRFTQTIGFYQAAIEAFLAMRKGNEN